MGATAAALRRGTAQKRAAFLEAFTRSGNATASARVAGVDRTTVQKWRKHSPEFDAQYQAALDELCDELEETLVEAARGGTVVAAMFLLKANRPDLYRENNVKVQATHEHSGPNGQPIPIAYFDASAALTAAVAAGSAADRGGAGLAGLLDGSVGDGAPLG